LKAQAYPTHASRISRTNCRTKQPKIASFRGGLRIAYYLWQSQHKVDKMGMAKSQDDVPNEDYCKPSFSKPEKSPEQMELELLLEELAEFIESEDGILIP
jgi:hypothetical protein